MTAEAESVLREALALSEDDRANVATELLASLGPAEDLGDVEQAWAVEIDRRIDRAETEGFPGDEWSVVRQRLVDKFSK